MAKTQDNVVTEGLSGRIAQLVFKQWFGRTVVGKRRRASTKEPDEETKQRRLRFKQAILYAKIAISDAVKKMFYASRAQPGQTAFNMACADFFSVPEIGEIDSSAYSGSIGSKIVVPVTEDIGAASVNVKIAKGDGTLVEEGAAEMETNGVNWVYTATVLNNSIAGDVITVTAKDRAGNLTDKQKTI
jgi:hypothetical protein